MSMRYSQGEGVNTSLSSIMYCTRVVCPSVGPSIMYRSFPVCVWVSSVARLCATKDAKNKDYLCGPTIPAGLNRPPPSKTTSHVTRFGTI